MSSETTNQEQQQAPERKKVSLADAVKQKLAAKNQQPAKGKQSAFTGESVPQMKSQINKKPNNQRKRMGV
ncbi:hypothetical protein [Paenibacillus sp. y28]|uniref:hypothetical protein n=1 Tax=Paenibacillus sp. y28 TaxID=3129110 RepID=UPI00301A8088